MTFCFIVCGWGFSLQINYFDVLWCGRTLFGYTWIRRNEVRSGERYQYVDGQFSWVVIRKGKNKAFRFQKVIRAL